MELTDPVEDALEPRNDAADATICERGDSTRRKATSFSYTGVRFGEGGDAALGDAGVTDDARESTDGDGADSAGSFCTGTNAFAAGRESAAVVGGLMGGVGAIEDAFDVF